MQQERQPAHAGGKNVLFEKKTECQQCQQIGGVDPPEAAGVEDPQRKFRSRFEVAQVEQEAADEDEKGDTGPADRAGQDVEQQHPFRSVYVAGVGDARIARKIIPDEMGLEDGENRDSPHKINLPEVLTATHDVVPTGFGSKFGKNSPGEKKLARNLLDVSYLKSL